MTSAIIGSNTKVDFTKTANLASELYILQMETSSLACLEMIKPMEKDLITIKTGILLLDCGRITNLRRFIDFSFVIKFLMI